MLRESGLYDFCQDGPDRGSFSIRRGGWRPTRVEFANAPKTQGGLAVRVLDVSGGESHPYQWQLTEEQNAAIYAWCHAVMKQLGMRPKTRMVWIPGLHRIAPSGGH